MRLFFAFDVPAAQCERLAARVPLDDCRPVPAERMHVTMRFVGDVPLHTREALAAALSRLEPTSGTARIRGVGTFPASRQPKVLWAGVEVDEAVAITQAAIETICTDAGLEPDHRPWTPHLTLARLRHRPDWLADFLERNAALETDPFPVHRIVLYDSVTRDGVLRYEPVASSA